MDEREFWNTYRQFNDGVTLSNERRQLIADAVRSAPREHPAATSLANDAAEHPGSESFTVQTADVQSNAAPSRAERTAGSTPARAASDPRASHTSPVARSYNPHSEASARPRPNARPTVRRVPGQAKRRLVLVLAACFALLLLAGGPVALASLRPPATAPSVPPQSAYESPIPPSSPIDSNSLEFTVRACAYDSGVPLASDTSTEIVFGRVTSGLDFRTDLPEDLRRYENDGRFTGCSFIVEGENIVRVQASISAGALYQAELRDLSVANDAHAVDEAWGWKPETRGTGTFAAYDELRHVLAYDDGLPNDSPEKTRRILLEKLIGQTIDLDVSALRSDASVGTAQTSPMLGLWVATTPETTDPTGAERTIFSVLDLFDGETLTITATFADGHTSTQIIELHAANVRIDCSRASADGHALAVSTEFLDGETIARKNLREGEIALRPIDQEGTGPEYGYLHTLCGIVVESNDEPFPCSLENANDLADDVPPAVPLPATTTL